MFSKLLKYGSIFMMLRSFFGRRGRRGSDYTGGYGQRRYDRRFSDDD